MHINVHAHSTICKCIVNILKRLFVVMIHKDHISTYTCLHVSDMVDFSDEEGYGKYLDLHECHTQFINLKGMEVG